MGEETHSHVHHIKDYIYYSKTVSTKKVFIFALILPVKGARLTEICKMATVIPARTPLVRHECENLLCALEGEGVVVRFRGSHTEISSISTVLSPPTYGEIYF